MECRAEGGRRSACIPAKERQIEMLEAQFIGEKSPLKFMINSKCWFQKKSGRELAFVEHLLWVRHCAENMTHVTRTSSFDPHYDPATEGLIYAIRS